MRRVPVANQALVLALSLELDAGEAEAIAVAADGRAESLLMDERLGRDVAARLGLPCVGIVGALILAKRARAIAAIGPLLDALRDVAGFRLSDALLRRVLQNGRER